MNDVTFHRSVSPPYDEEAVRLNGYHRSLVKVFFYPSLGHLSSRDAGQVQSARRVKETRCGGQAAHTPSLSSPSRRPVQSGPKAATVVAETGRNKSQIGQSQVHALATVDPRYQYYLSRGI
jgi:hypothetical protein